ncbi:MAG: AAA family ATPase, partial [Clostridium sp.]
LSVVKAYEDLSKEYDIVVLEGAGSPAEININTDDIVNMGMAKIANSPVLLVGDIERGGVFASIYGTLMLLKEDERSMVKGILINKFRGNINLLDTGITMLEDITNTSVIGTIPYTDIDIEDEDSLSESFKDKTSNIYKESYSREELRIYKEKQYDSLADMLRENIDMKEIYKILEMGL